MPSPDRIELSVHQAHDRACAASVGGRPLEEGRIALSPLHIDWRHHGLARPFEGLKRLIRPLVVVMYLAPLLVVAKAAFYLTGAPGGHWITVGFVVLVVLFFTLLAALVLLFPLVGPRSARKPRPALTLDRRDMDQALRSLHVVPPQWTSSAALAQLCRSGARDVAEPVRLRGRARGTRPAEDDTLVCVRWLARDDTVGRLVTAQVFHLELDGPPVVVDPGQGLLLLADHRPGGSSGPHLDDAAARPLADWLRRKGSDITVAALESEGLLARIRRGDEVELFALRAEVVDNIDELAVAGRRLQLPSEAPGAAPYRADRGGRPGLLVTGGPGAPVVLRVL